jgi:SPP1 family phage portal protein
MALSVAEIKKFIADDTASEKKRRAAVGARYYNSEHDILKSRLFYFNAEGKLVEDTTRANIKIVHPFFMILADQLSSYMLSGKENPIQAKKKDDGLQDLLDDRFDDEFWAEIGELITGAYAKGFEYVYRYKNADNKSVYQCADSMGVVEVPERDADDGQDHIIYHYADTIDKGKKTVRRIQDWTATESRHYVQIGDGEIVPDDSAAYNPRPHVVYTDEETGQKMGKPFGFIPFWRLDYCKQQHSGLKPIKGLIDDYDLHACSLSNNLTDFDTPLYVVSGFQGDNLDELQQNLKTKKIVGVDSEGGVSVQTVEIPYEARKAKLEIDERNIYIFGMGFNPAQVGDGNITNIVILSRYTLLDLKKSKLDKRLKKLLRQIIKVELDEINEEHGTDYQMSDIKIDLTPEIPTNEAENLQNEKLKAETEQIKTTTILNVAAQIGDDAALQALCDILELDYEELKGQVEKLREEQKLTDAKDILAGVITDEQTAETGSGEIPE